MRVNEFKKHESMETRNMVDIDRFIFAPFAVRPFLVKL